MTSETDEVMVNYFVLCDQVITEAHTGKQSLIGIYSALITDQLPVQANMAVALGIRVQSARARELSFQFTGPEGEIILKTPPLPQDWSSVENGIRANGHATLQIGLNLQALPISRTGLYNATMYCDGSLLATYPFAVLPGMPPGR